MAITTEQEYREALKEVKKLICNGIIEKPGLDMMLRNIIAYEDRHYPDRHYPTDKLTPEEAGRVSDVMANAVNKSKLTINKLKIAFNYISKCDKCGK